MHTTLFHQHNNNNIKSRIIHGTHLTHLPKIDDVRVNAPSVEDLRVLHPTQIDSQTRSMVSSIAIDNIIHAQPVYSSVLPSSSIPVTQSAIPVDREIKIDMPMTRDIPIDINIWKSAPQQWSYEKIQSPMVPKESHKRKLESWIPDSDVQEEKEGLLEKKREIAPVDTEDLYDFTYVPRPEKQQLANKQREILATTPRDAVLLGKWYRLRKELGGKGYLMKPKEFGRLTLKHVEPNLYKSYWINRSTPSDVIELEEKERQDRMMRGANPLLLGKVHKVNKQLDSNNFSIPSTKGFSFTENIDAEKYQMKRQNKKPLGQWSSQYAWGTYVPRRVPVEIISLEEAERESRALQGANPLLLGKIHKINNQLKSINFVMPTSNKGSFYALKRRSLGNNWDNTPITFSCPRFIPAEIRQMEEMERADRLTREINPTLMGKLHLVHRELYTKTFAWAPAVGEMIKEQSVNAAESIIEKGSDLVNAVVEEAPVVAEYVKEKSVDLADAVAERAPSMLENAEHAAGKVAHVGVEAASAIGRFTFGLVGNFYESAKDKLGYVDHASLTYIHAAEEKERLERMNKKVDPMIEAKKANVQDQLLSMVKTAN